MSLSITSFTPETGIVGTEVTITGTGFGTAATVSFYNGISAVVDSCTDTTIATHVPIGATNGPITVAVDGADMNTSSLLHFQNRVWIFAGTAQIDISQQPFATGGSLLLDGDSDYLSTPDSADFAFGSGDLTIDFWFRLASDGADQCFISQPEGVGYSPIALIFQTSSKKISLFMSSDGSSWAVTQAGTLTYNATAWYHFAAVRNGNNWRTYQNGAIDIDITNSLALRDSASSFYVGSNGLGQYVNGSIGELRITKGLARWTADFSASLPTAKYADDANTVSLLHFDEADGSTFTKDVAANWTMDGAAQFYDETGKLWTVGGTAQLDTSVYKWTGSLLLDGNGDYISSSASDDFRYDADFTVDCWIRPAAVDGIRTFYDCRGSAGSSAGFALFIESGYIKVYCASRTITGLTLLVTGNWYHVAIARSGTDVKLFLGGTQEGSTWSTSANFSDGNAIVGQVIDNQHFFSGNIDELRISKGIARWTDSFTPSVREYGAVIPVELTVELTATLEDVVSDFLLTFPGLGFENITIEYSLVAETFDDFAVLAEYQAVYYKDLAARFELVQPNAYNFVDISVLFETLLGESYENVSVIFSIVKESQSFKSYILQKLYCVVSYPEGNFYYDVVLENWNVSPNKTWFVSVIGYAEDEYETGNLITLYDTLIDLQTHTNAVSYGYLNTDTLEVVLIAADEYDEDPAYYYQDLKYHLMLSGVVEEGEEYQYKVKPLTDLDEIRHPIYNNSNIAFSRGEAELDLHTYAVLGRELVLGTHLPVLEPGDVVNLTSTRRGETAKKSQILGETITGSISEDGTASLITSINVANYLELSR